MIIYRQSFLNSNQSLTTFHRPFAKAEKYEICVFLGLYGINVLVQSSSDTVMKAWIVSIIKFGRGICPIKINDELYGSNHPIWKKGKGYEVNRKTACPHKKIPYSSTCIRRNTKQLAIYLSELKVSLLQHFIFFKIHMLNCKVEKAFDVAYILSI